LESEAFYRAESRLVPAVLGRVSPYHTAAGIHAVRAMIARSQGDAGAWREAADAFVAASRQPCPSLDLTLGRSGSLLAAALLLEGLPEGVDEPPPALRILGEELLAGLWEEIAAFPPIAECGGRPNLGMAHGWAGFLYASLRWCRASGTPLPDSLAARLGELAAEARPAGRGVRWRWHAENGADVGTMAGWCNGSAGFVYLWTLAHRTLGDPRFAALAEGAAWNAWEDPARDPNLCCGLAGRAYALLELHRHGGGAEWLERARDLAERAARETARNTEPSHSLYKGEVGLAVLAADLADPEGAAFPFFAEEGWAEGK
jgi:serine/threonine-protein kinase